MKILLCCTWVPAKYEVEIREISNAANRFLSNLCEQLRVNNSLKMISYIGIKVDNDTKEVLRTQESECIRYVFKNGKIIGGIWKMLCATWKELGNCDYAITYNVVYSWMLTPVLAKLHKKTSVLILADYSPAESFKDKKQQIYAKIQKFFIGQYDYVIGLSEKTSKFLKPQQKFLCMEGGISEEVYCKFKTYSPVKKEKITMMYSGILEEVTGIDLLVDAFKGLGRKDVQLVITGDGSKSEWIKDISQRYENIHYLGCVPYEDYMKKLQEADVLINPRNMNLPENFNNFPSKIMEFLATGKMIVSTKFPGWERFQEYILFCESDCESIAKTIEQCILKAEQRNEENYKNNREFAKKFLWSSQVESIMNFVGDDK